MSKSSKTKGFLNILKNYYGPSTMHMLNLSESVTGERELTTYYSTKLGSLLRQEGNNIIVLFLNGMRINKEASKILASSLKDNPHCHVKSLILDNANIKGLEYLIEVISDEGCLVNRLQLNSSGLGNREGLLIANAIYKGNFAQYLGLNNNQIGKEVVSLLRDVISSSEKLNDTQIRMFNNPGSVAFYGSQSDIQGDDLDPISSFIKKYKITPASLAEMDEVYQQQEQTDNFNTGNIRLVDGMTSSQRLLYDISLREGPYVSSADGDGYNTDYSTIIFGDSIDYWRQKGIEEYHNTIYQQLIGEYEE